ncbi:hypothetical protein BC829DRAFT_38743 [Chytridium lagenaria]|nr:hypothetical protein BC829DRAFT_38743 [Chytridium lagenaria]
MNSLLEPPSSCSAAPSVEQATCSTPPADDMSLLTIMLYGGIGGMSFVAIGIFVLFKLTGSYPSVPASKYTRKRTVKQLPANLPKRDDPGRQAPPPAAKVAIAIIGGSGCVGQYLYESLLYRGDTNVYLFDLNPPPRHFMALFPKATFIPIDMTDSGSLREAFAKYEIKVVFHAAAIITFMHFMDFQKKLSMDINYKGTLNIVEACLAVGVERLVFVSTSHVAVGFDRYHVDGDESVGYTAKPFNHYARSKILSEKAVLAADNSVGATGVKLRTSSVRPCSAIWGFGDHFNSDFYLSKTSNIVTHTSAIDYIYVENLTHALSLVENGLREQPDKVGGQAFCVSEHDAMSAASFKNVLRAADPTVGPAEQIPHILIWCLSLISTVNQYVFRGKVSLGDLDAMSLSSYHTMMSQFIFKSDKIRLLLGFRPLYSAEEGAVITVHRRREAAPIYGGVIPLDLRLPSHGGRKA